MKYSYKQIQGALIEAGYSCGKAGADGVWGRDSIAACKRFQAAKGLLVDGIPGRDTLTALFPPKKATKTTQIDDSELPLPWYGEAQRWLGKHEARDFEDLTEFMDETGIGDIRKEAWCGAYVDACMSRTLPDEPLPNNPLGARNWALMGREIEPQIGAVLVFWREKKTGWKGHVGFMSGEDASHYHVLGGNQSNAVSVARVPKERFLNARWPTTAPFLQTGRGEAARGVAAEGSEA